MMPPERHRQVMINHRRNPAIDCFLEIHFWFLMNRSIVLVHYVGDNSSGRFRCARSAWVLSLEDQSGSSQRRMPRFPQECLRTAMN